MDFVLWKPSTDQEPGWASPWGRGRPGWHIECSAMSHELLGPSFDIHGGGLDLQFPHHENEIAQSCCAHPEADFAKVWMHNEMLQVEGKKMSKSLGNFFTVRDLLKQRVPGEVIRFVMLGTHYSKPMDWTKEKAEQAKETLIFWRGIVTGVRKKQVDSDFLNCLSDDLNTAGAVAILHELARSGRSGELAASAEILGLLTNDLSDWPQQDSLSSEIRSAVERLTRKWIELRRKKDFAGADKLRDSLLEVGIRLVVEKTNESSWRYENPDIATLDEREARIVALSALEEGQ